MRLAKPDAPVKENRVEGGVRTLGDTARGGMGKLVRLADDETLEGEARIKRRGLQRMCGHSRRLGRAPDFLWRRLDAFLDLDREAPDMAKLRLEIAQQMQPVIALDPIRDKARRRAEDHAILIDFRKADRADPLLHRLAPELALGRFDNLLPDGVEPVGFGARGFSLIAHDLPVHHQPSPRTASRSSPRHSALTPGQPMHLPAIDLTAMPLVVEITLETFSDINAADRMPFRIRSLDRKSTRLNSSHVAISYAVFCLKKKTKNKLLTY